MIDQSSGADSADHPRKQVPGDRHDHWLREHWLQKHWLREQRERTATAAD
ncbi:MAG: hypothetical protein H6835_11840 [Planctomycetes bacterium]|nr:hypothetical protein [Planctomycetota bacterium]